MKTRIGKIAQLPKLIRDELNQRLQNGKQGPELLKWLNALPETQALLAEKFDAIPLSKQNLSEWRQGGYEEWLRHQEHERRLQRLVEEGESLGKHDADSDNDLFEHSARIALAELMADFDSLHELKGEERTNRLRTLTRELTRLQYAYNHSRWTALAYSKWNERFHGPDDYEEDEDETPQPNPQIELRNQISPTASHSLSVITSCSPTQDKATDSPTPGRVTKFHPLPGEEGWGEEAFRVQGENSPKPVARIEPRNQKQTTIPSPSPSRSGGEGWGEVVLRVQGEGQGGTEKFATPLHQSQEPNETPEVKPDHTTSTKGESQGAPASRPAQPLPSPRPDSVALPVPAKPDDRVYLTRPIHHCKGCGCLCRTCHPADGKYPYAEALQDSTEAKQRGVQAFWRGRTLINTAPTECNCPCDCKNAITLHAPPTSPSVSPLGHLSPISPIAKPKTPREIAEQNALTDFLRQAALRKSLCPQNQTNSPNNIW